MLTILSWIVLLASSAAGLLFIFVAIIISNRNMYWSKTETVYVTITIIAFCASSAYLFGIW